MTYKLIQFFFLLQLFGCENEAIYNGYFLQDKEMISQLNTKSYDTLKIESDSFVLDAYIWRDFMPVSPPDGKPMISINWLRSIDSTKIPDYIELTRQYVICNDSVWISEYENESQPDQPDYKIYGVSRNGPKWGPGIYVDVISNVHDVRTNTDYLIRIKHVFVLKTD